MMVKIWPAAIISHRKHEDKNSYCSRKKWAGTWTNILLEWSQKLWLHGFLEKMSNINSSFLYIYVKMMSFSSFLHIWMNLSKKKFDTYFYEKFYEPAKFWKGSIFLFFEGFKCQNILVLPFVCIKHFWYILKHGTPWNKPKPPEINWNEPNPPEITHFYNNTSKTTHYFLKQPKSVKKYSQKLKVLQFQWKWAQWAISWC